MSFEFNMSIELVVVILFILSTLYAIWKGKKKSRPEVKKAIDDIFAIKKKHHDRIVLALENGASESEHLSLLEEKRIEVLAAMEEAETRLSIVIDKKNPTEPGPVVVLEQ